MIIIIVIIIIINIIIIIIINIIIIIIISQSCGCDVSNVDGGNYDDNDGGLRNCSNENSEEHCGHQQRLCIR